ncbi:MAG TPA: hypothetical protein VGR71_11845 [Nitrospira sp.]|nr:hypothetical protein [Nitrospira sp.]
MTNVALVPTPFGWVPGQQGVDITPSTLTALGAGVTTVTFPNYNGNVILIINNGSAGTVNVQPVAIRTVEQQSVTVPVYAVPIGKVQAFGPFPPNDFNVAGIMTVNVAGAASVTGGAFQMTTAPSQI